MAPKAPVVRRPISTRLILLALSSVPFLCAFLIIRFQFLRYVAAWIEQLGMIGISIFFGLQWFRLITDRPAFFSKQKYEDDGLDHSNDWFAVINAHLFGFGVLLLLYELNSHEMVRAFTKIWDH